MLRHIYLQPTRACDLNCLWCTSPERRQVGDAPTSSRAYRQTGRVLERLFAQAKVDRVTLVGAEPMLAERVLDTVLYCRARGKRVAVRTHGVVAGLDALAALHSLGVDRFEIPLLAGDAHTHDRLTGIEGSWERACRSIDFLQSLGARVVAAVVLCSLNVHRLRDTLLLLDALGVAEVQLRRLCTLGRGAPEHLWLLPRLDELSRAHREATRLSAERQLSVRSWASALPCPLSGLDHAPPGPPGTELGVAQLGAQPWLLEVSGDLRLSMCAAEPAGNLLRSKLSSIVTSALAQVLRPSMAWWPCELCPGNALGCGEVELRSTPRRQRRLVAHAAPLRLSALTGQRIVPS